MDNTGNVFPHLRTKKDSSSCRASASTTGGMFHWDGGPNREFCNKTLWGWTRVLPLFFIVLNSKALSTRVVVRAPHHYDLQTIKKRNPCRTQPFIFLFILIRYVVGNRTAHTDANTVTHGRTQTETHTDTFNQYSRTDAPIPSQMEGPPPPRRPRPHPPPPPPLPATTPLPYTCSSTRMGVVNTWSSRRNRDVCMSVIECTS